jgi:uncharacterized metal-binding protein
MGEVYSKVGVISCSGEEIPEGTIARQAVRRVLEGLRPQQTVTLCLPLFLAGEEGERRFAREHPTITVDGCSKLCAKRGTEKYSGKVNTSLVVGDILGDRAKGCHRSTRNTDKADEEAVWLLAERIASEVDALAGSHRIAASSEPAADGACCACSKPSQEGMLEIRGKLVAVAGLPLIFEQLRKKGIRSHQDCADTLVKTVSVYHFIDTHDEADYRDALVTAYQAYCRR